MKNINQKMLENITVFSISGIIILLANYLLHYHQNVFTILNQTIKILMPFISGFALAFLLEPIYSRLYKFFVKKISDDKSRFVAVIVTMVLFISFLVGFFALVIPQLVVSIRTVITIITDNVSSIDKYLEQFLSLLGLNGDDFQAILKYLSSFSENILNEITKLLPNLLDGSLNVISTLISMIIGIMIAAYILFDRKKLYGQIKKVLYAFSKKTHADYLVDVSNLSSRLFKKFIIGKIIDSIILGIICYCGMLIFNFEFAMFISMIITITNVIPVFGPFIGAIPSVLILLIIDPVQALWFSIFVLALQQFDGNVLGPYILGDSMGLPIIWVVFAIIVGGGLFGIIGMFLGIPVFALFYFLLKSIVYKRLEQKNIQIE